MDGRIATCFAKSDRRANPLQHFSAEFALRFKTRQRNQRKTRESSWPVGQILRPIRARLSANGCRRVGRNTGIGLLMEQF